MKRLLFSLLLVVGCNAQRAPLPGDSVQADGAVSLKSPALTTNLTAASVPATPPPAGASSAPDEHSMATANPRRTTITTA